MKAPFYIIAGLALSAPAMSQDLISPQTFLELVDGKTLTFHDYHSQRLVGVEEYLSPTLSVWRDTSGVCVYGKITTEDGKICFLYDNDTDGVPICWWPFLDGDKILVRTARFIDVQVQEVVAIKETSLSCPSVPAA